MIQTGKTILGKARMRMAGSVHVLVQQWRFRLPRFAHAPIRLWRTMRSVASRNLISRGVVAVKLWGSTLRSPIGIIHLAFVPLLLFLAGVPLMAKSDDLTELASPREISILSGKARQAITKRLLLPDIATFAVKQQLWLTVTAYSSTPDQTDGDPLTTASGAKVRHGIIAHNGLPFGTKVRFPDMFGDQVFVVQDRMNARYGSRMADLWMPSRYEAKQWGVRKVRMEVLGEKPS